MFNEKVIKVDADPDEVLSFLELYFDKQNSKRNFLGQYFKLTVLDSKQRTFKFKEVPMSRSCCFLGQISEGDQTSIKIWLHPLNVFACAIGIFWFGYLLMLDWSFFLLPAIIIFPLIVHSYIYDQKDVAVRIEKGVEAYLNESNSDHDVKTNRTSI